MVDKKEVESLIKWWDELEDTQGLDFTKLVIFPLMEAFGDDVEEILVYLNEMDVDDLDEIEGCFPEIYGKFMADEVYDALEKLEERINRDSTRMKEFREKEKQRKTEALGTG